LSVWGSTFQDNTADAEDEAGGAIFSYGDPDEIWMTVTLRDAEICGNSNPQLQGHVYLNDLDAKHATEILADCSPGTCAGDTNGDGTVDIVDLLAVISAWGPCP
jgi:hypothetical protein